MAALVLASQSKIDYDWFVFCDVGADSENPDTIKYVDEVAIPFAKQHGIKLEIIHKRDRHGARKTLYQTIYTDKKSIIIPMYMGGGSPGNRTCTVDFKIKPFQLYAFQNRGEAAGVRYGLGITVDEIQRARTTEPEMIRSKFYAQRDYPLLDLRLSLNDCVNIVHNAGLPVPPKSSCYFCPFHTATGWLNLKREQPDLFQKSVAIELHLNETRRNISKDEVYLHRSLKPLNQAVGDQASFFDNDFCESGFCMT
jgi:hypothetical protein